MDGSGAGPAVFVSASECGGPVRAVLAMLEIGASDQKLREWACAVCGGAFASKKRACAALDADSMKLMCHVRDEAMRDRGHVHVVHAYCGPCPCQYGVELPLRMPARLRVGFDVGGVIVPAATGGDEDTLLGDSFASLLPVEGCVELLAALVLLHGPDSVFIVSKAGDRVKRNTLKWISQVQLLQRTGMLACNVHFVTERSHKAPLCAKLGVNVFVDDHLSVLAAFSASSTCRVYFKDAALVESSNVLFYNPDVRHVAKFEQLKRLLAVYFPILHNLLMTRNKAYTSSELTTRFIINKTLVSVSCGANAIRPPPPPPLAPPPALLELDVEGEDDMEAAGAADAADWPPLDGDDPPAVRADCFWLSRSRALLSQNLKLSVMPDSVRLEMVPFMMVDLLNTALAEILTLLDFWSSRIVMIHCDSTRK